MKLDETAGVLVLRRSATGELPEALIPPRPITTTVQRRALERLGAAMQAGDGRYRALQDIVARARPRFTEEHRRDGAGHRSGGAAPARGRSRRELSRHPGAARHRQDVDGRPTGDRSHPPRPARRGGGDEPQGDSQPARPDRGSRRDRTRQLPRTQEVQRGHRGDRIRERLDPEHRGARGVRDGGHRRPASGRDRVAVRARGARRHARYAGDRRGRAGGARRCAGDGDGRAQRDPAGRSAAARPGLAGHPSRGHGRLRAGAPARGASDRAAGPGDLPGSHATHASRRLSIHLGGRLRRSGWTACRRSRVRTRISAPGCAFCPSSTSATSPPRPRRPSASRGRSAACGPGRGPAAMG